MAERSIESGQPPDDPMSIGDLFKKIPDDRKGANDLFGSYNRFDRKVETNLKDAKDHAEQAVIEFSEYVPVAAASPDELGIIALQLYIEMKQRQGIESMLDNLHKKRQNPQDRG